MVISHPIPSFNMFFVIENIITTYVADLWDKDEKPSKNVRYVPIQIAAGHPSTSTPNEVPGKSSRVRTVPIKLVGVSENGPSTPSRKPRMHTPVKPIIHAVIDDEDDDDQEVI